MLGWLRTKKSPQGKTPRAQKKSPAFAGLMLLGVEQADVDT